MIAWAFILLPVLLFLGVLILLDSYRLVRPSLLAMVFLSGSAATLAAYLANSQLALLTGLSDHFSSRYIAPVVEESLKASVLLLLIVWGKVGFMIDAALYGFAAGAGFAFAENIYYLTAIAEPDLIFLTIRGFGTAIMHCGTTALLGVIVLGERGAGKKLPAGLIPGLLLAVLIHSAFNHFYLHPHFKNMGELTLKPFRLRNAGLTWLYPVYVKASLFSTHLLTDFDQPEMTRNVFNFGGQVDVQLVLFSYMKSTWSAGYALKTEKKMPGRHQWMFSLKLLGD